EDGGEKQRLFHVVYGLADGDGAVVHHIELDRRRQRGAHFRQQRIYAIRSLDDIGAGLFAEHHKHGRHAVGEAEIADVLHAVFDLRDVREAHGGVVAIGDDEVLVFVGLARGVVDVKLVAAVVLLDGAFGAVGVGGGKGRAHVFQADAVFEQRARVEFDTHGG